MLVGNFYVPMKGYPSPCHDTACCVAGNQQRVNQLEATVPKLYMQELVQERCTEEMAMVTAELNAAINTLTRQQNKIDSAIQVGDCHAHQHEKYICHSLMVTCCSAHETCSPSCCSMHETCSPSCHVLQSLLPLTVAFMAAGPPFEARCSSGGSCTADSQ